MILLDTNVISALMQQTPEPKVVSWLDRQPRLSVWTTAITVFEIRSGLQLMAVGKRRDGLIDCFEGVLTNLLQERIVPFDATAAAYTADLDAARQKARRPGELRDTMIAGITLASRAKLATRNVRHFSDIASSVVNPWTA